MKKLVTITAFIGLCLSLNWSIRTSLVVESQEGFSKADSEKLARVVDGVELIINSDEFRSEIINFEYNGKKQFKDNEGRSNEDIYAIIQAGKEDLKPDIDFKWNLYYKIGKLAESAVAQTSPTISVVTFNQTKFPKFLDSNFAGTICHEQLHKLGFDHDFLNSPSRPYSVPYGVGSICTKLYRKMILDDSPAKVPYCGIWCRIRKIF